MHPGTIIIEYGGGINTMKLEKDPVVEEIRKTRKKLFKRCHNNPYEYGKLLLENSKKRKIGTKKVTKQKTSA